MPTKEEILDAKGIGGGHWQHRVQVHEAMGEFAKQQSLAFAEFLADNTRIIYEDKITLYRYTDKNNETGNYTLEDIYTEFND